MHILSASQFDRSFLDNICQLTDSIRKYSKSKFGTKYLQSLCSDKRAMLYFTQASTRTFLSFKSACQILGIQSSDVRDTSTSSEVKGETIEDSLRVFSSYVDTVIMRTPTPGLCDRIANLLDQTPRPIPIINAGSGPDEHPTQALLDIYTLYRSFENEGGLANRIILMVGDLKRGRTIRSLSLLLSNYPNIKIIFSAPKEFQIDDDLRQKLSGQDFEETEDFESVLPVADAIYMTRVQDEYDSNGESKNIPIEKYYLKYEHLNVISPNCVIMHPLPRRHEIDHRIDNDPRAKYWRQVRNGMWVRVALLTKVLEVSENLLP